MRASGSTFLGMPVLDGHFRNGFVLKVILTLFYVFMAAPIVGLVALSLSGSSGPFRLEWSQGLGASISDTVQLLVGVGLFSSGIGVGAAWLIAMCRFPGREVLAILLVLPLALPTYLAAYVAVELTDYFGPAQTAVRWIFGYASRRDYAFPELRSLPGAIFVLSLVLYPYVYLPCRLMFERQGSSVIQAARLHGSKGLGLFFRVGLPLARPAVVGGMTFALIETLNDVGAVEHLGVQSLSLTIRSIWLNRGNLPGAAQIALIGLMLVMAMLLVEYVLRRHASFAASSRVSAPVAPAKLSGLRACAAMTACSLPVIFGFAVPAVFLAYEAGKQFIKSGLPMDILDPLVTSFALSAIAGGLVAVFGACIALSARLVAGPAARHAPRIATVGYAIPGTVLVIALLPLYGLTDDIIEKLGFHFAVSGSVAAILIAYLVRFTGIGVAQSETALARISSNVDYAARTLGRGVTQTAFGVLGPNILRAVGLAALFAFVDAMKELPATLLLRPLNTETLATSLYAKASGGTFEAGAFEGLLLLLVGLVPVALLARAR